MAPTKTSFVKGHGAASIVRQAPRTNRFAMPPGPQGEWQELDLGTPERRSFDNSAKQALRRTVQPWQDQPPVVRLMRRGQGLVSQMGLLLEYAVDRPDKHAGRKNVMQEGQGGNKIEVMCARSVVWREQGAQLAAAPQNPVALCHDDGKVLHVLEDVTADNDIETVFGERQSLTQSRRE